LKQLKVAISTLASMPSGRKSTEFAKQILVTYPRSFVISKLTKDATRKSIQTKTSQENSQFLVCHEILHAKRQGGGRVTYFLKKNIFIALVTYKI
jgi:transcriptional regulator of met regulon